MTEAQRIADARELIKSADSRLQEAPVIPDPVFRRRRLVEVAHDLVAAAEILTDQGWLTE